MNNVTLFDLQRNPDCESESKPGQSSNLKRLPNGVKRRSVVFTKNFLVNTQAGCHTAPCDYSYTKGRLEQGDRRRFFFTEEYVLLC